MAVKNRNPFVVVILSIITLGIYALYWFYQTRGELNELTGKTTHPIVWILLCFIPFAGIYVLWRHCADLAQASKGSANAVMLFLLWFFIFPVGMFLYQGELNKLATK